MSIQIKVSIDIVKLITIIGYKLEVHVCGQQRTQAASVLLVLISLHLSFFQVHMVFQCAKMFARSY